MTHAGAAFAGEHLGYSRFDLLPGHARGQHGQRMAQVDHVIDARTEEIVGGGAGKQHGRTPRKQPLLEIKLGVPAIGHHPKDQCLCGLRGFFRDDHLVPRYCRVEIEQFSFVTGVPRYGHLQLMVRAHEQPFQATNFSRVRVNVRPSSGW